MLMGSDRIQGWFFLLLGIVLVFVGLLSAVGFLTTYWQQGHTGEMVARPAPFGRAGLFDEPRRMTLVESLGVPTFQVVVGWLLVGAGRRLVGSDWSDE